MPSGEVHRKIWKDFLPYALFIGLLFGLFINWYIALFIVAGYFLHGLGVTNDLDLSGTNSDEMFWTKTIVLTVLLPISALYAEALRKIGGHRGFWSHSFIVSSFIRLILFTSPFIFIFRYFFVDSLWREYLGMWIGISIADAIHSIADYGTTEGLPFFPFQGKQSKIIKWFLKKKYDFPSDKVIKDKELRKQIQSMKGSSNVKTKTRSRRKTRR